MVKILTSYFASIFGNWSKSLLLTLLPFGKWSKSSLLTLLPFCQEGKLLLFTPKYAFLKLCSKVQDQYKIGEDNTGGGYFNGQEDIKNN
jgi:hypothetical protein